MRGIGREIGGPALESHKASVRRDFWIFSPGVAAAGAGPVHAHQHGHAGHGVAEKNVGVVVGVAGHQIAGLTVEGHETSVRRELWRVGVLVAGHAVGVGADERDRAVGGVEQEHVVVAEVVITGREVVAVAHKGGEHAVGADGVVVTVAAAGRARGPADHLVRPVGGREGKNVRVEVGVLAHDDLGVAGVSDDVRSAADGRLVGIIVRAVHGAKPPAGQRGHAGKQVAMVNLRVTQHPARRQVQGVTQEDDMPPVRAQARALGVGVARPRAAAVDAHQHGRVREHVAQEHVLVAVVVAGHEVARATVEQDVTPVAAEVHGLRAAVAAEDAVRAHRDQPRDTRNHVAPVHLKRGQRRVGGQVRGAAVEEHIAPVAAEADVLVARVVVARRGAGEVHAHERRRVVGQVAEEDLLETYEAAHRDEIGGHARIRGEPAVITQARDEAAGVGRAGAGRVGHHQLRLVRREVADVEQIEAGEIRRLRREVAARAGEQHDLAIGADRPQARLGADVNVGLAVGRRAVGVPTDERGRAVHEVAQEHVLEVVPVTRNQVRGRAAEEHEAPVAADLRVSDVVVRREGIVHAGRGQHVHARQPVIDKRLLVVVVDVRGEVDRAAGINHEAPVVAQARLAATAVNRRGHQAGRGARGHEQVAGREQIVVVENRQRRVGLVDERRAAGGIEQAQGQRLDALAREVNGDRHGEGANQFAVRENQCAVRGRVVAARQRGQVRAAEIHRHRAHRAAPALDGDHRLARAFQHGEHFRGELQDARASPDQFVAAGPVAEAGLVGRRVEIVVGEAAVHRQRANCDRGRAERRDAAEQSGPARHIQRALRDRAARRERDAIDIEARARVRGRVRAEVGDGVDVAVGLPGHERVGGERAAHGEIRHARESELAVEIVRRVVVRLGADDDRVEIQPARARRGHGQRDGHERLIVQRAEVAHDHAVVAGTGALRGRHGQHRHAGRQRVGHEDGGGVRGTEVRDRDGVGEIGNQRDGIGGVRDGHREVHRVVRHHAACKRELRGVVVR